MPSVSDTCWNINYRAKLHRFIESRTGNKLLQHSRPGIVDHPPIHGESVYFHVRDQNNPRHTFLFQSLIFEQISTNVIQIVLKIFVSLFYFIFISYQIGLQMKLEFLGKFQKHQNVQIITIGVANSLFNLYLQF